jgi:hypothetical protein
MNNFCRGNPPVVAPLNWGRHGGALPLQIYINDVERIQEIMMPMMTIKDLENLQLTLSEAGHDYQLELEDGKIIVMGPSDIVR